MVKSHNCKYRSQNKSIASSSNPWYQVQLMLTQEPYTQKIKEEKGRERERERIKILCNWGCSQCRDHHSHPPKLQTQMWLSSALRMLKELSRSSQTPLNHHIHFLNIRVKIPNKAKQSMNKCSNPFQNKPPISLSGMQCWPCLNFKSRRNTLVGFVTVVKNSKGKALFGWSSDKERDKEIRQVMCVRREG